MNTDAHTTDRNPEAIKPTSPGTRLVLLLLITAGAVLTGLCSNLFVAGIFAAVTAGLFTYYYLLTFSPAVTLTVIPAAGIVLSLTGSVLSAATVLLYLPLGAVLSLCMLRIRTKTTAVISGAAAIGLSLGVLFLIGYMTQHGTIAAEALKESYNTFFESMRTSMMESMMTAFEAMETAAEQSSSLADHPVIGGQAVTEAVTDAASGNSAAVTGAYIKAMVNLSVDSVKLAMPALLAIGAQVLSYLAVGVYLLAVRIRKTTWMRPSVYRITVSRTAAVIFMLAYLINMLPLGSSISMIQIASANLATLMMPGMFIMGLYSLRRRALDVHRRRSFIVTLVVLGILVFVSPSFAIFFVIVDGLGEIFFGGRSIF